MKACTEALVKAFGALTMREKRNLRWHLDQGTPVLCGENANRVTDFLGGG